jgi:hypothetical protein
LISPGFAEQLYSHITEGKNERFEVKVLALDVISRLIGIHQLFVFNFYTFFEKTLKPHTPGKLLQSDYGFFSSFNYVTSEFAFDL